MEAGTAEHRPTKCLKPTVSGTVGVVKAETSRRDRRDSRWDEHRRARREQLVDATIAAVGRHGAGVGMEEIATAAGTSKAVVYRHFADRTELHVAVCARVAANLTDRLREAMDTTSDPRQMLTAAVETYLAFLEADLELYRFVVQGPPVGHPGADGDVQLGAVGEVPVDDGLAGASGSGDLLHADARAVPAHRGDGGVDQLLAAGATVLVPPRVTAVAPAPDLHDTNGT